MNFKSKKQKYQSLHLHLAMKYVYIKRDELANIEIFLKATDITNLNNKSCFKNNLHQQLCTKIYLIIILCAFITHKL